MKQDSLHAAARMYAEAGFPVFPLHGIRNNGTCTCGTLECRNVGKHPRTFHGLHDATDNLSQVDDWWKRWPKANIGILTGPVTVLDVDPRHGGDESLRDLVSDHGREWLDTVTALTGGGGQHLYYLRPEGCTVRNSSGLLAPGLDVRGTGGYVIAPPSLHESGQRYTWEAGFALGEAPIRPLPDWLIERLGAVEEHGNRPLSGDGIPQGQRNATLASIAGSMRRRGLTAAEMLPSLLEVNKRRCVPPLPDREVHRIALSVGRYPVSASPGVVALRKGPRGSIHVA